MTDALIISTGYEPEYLRIVEQISLECVKNGLTPTVVDLAPLMKSPTDTYAPSVLALGKFTSPGKLFEPRLRELGIRLLTAPSQPSTMATIPESAQNVLEESTQSALLTYFRTDQLDFRKKRVKRTRENLLSEGRRSFEYMTELLQSVSPAIAYIPNGRFPVQRMAKLALLNAGVTVHHFEKGATKDHAFFRPYSPHDRIASQGDVDKVLQGLSAQQIENVADSWLTSRLPSQNSSNEYAAIWEAHQSKKTEHKDSKPIIGFFTSSQDEFLHLGPDWQLHSWKSQFEAFETLLSSFEAQGYQCFLRIHPNLSTKDHACFTRELVGLKNLIEHHPNLIVYWHDNPTSSYTLLEECAGIVVWDSTIGLEASARGIPVWNCAASYYGLIADTRQVLGPEDLDEQKLALWKVDAHKAKRFIACSVLRDLPLTTDANDWASWDVSAPPFIVRASTFVRSGGAPTFIDSFLATFDPWRHRSWSVNKKLLKAKISRLRNS